MTSSTDRVVLVCLLEDEEGTRIAGENAPLFIYPNQRSRSRPASACVSSDVRDGHFGPRSSIRNSGRAGRAVPDRLTPSTRPPRASTGNACRITGVAADPALTADSLPDWIVAREHLWKFSMVHFPSPPPRLCLAQQALDSRTHRRTRLRSTSRPALSLKAHRKARAARRALVLTRAR
jgi:hypothetical protein